MFSSLPQKITVPFNLLGDEAKLAFRSKPTGIAKLATTRVRAVLRVLLRAQCSLFCLAYFRDRLVLGSSELKQRVLVLSQEFKLHYSMSYSLIQHRMCSL